jgi:hypothetical protein
MNGGGKSPFDPKIFLARVGAGKTRAELRKRQVVVFLREILQMPSSTSRKAKSS